MVSKWHRRALGLLGNVGLAALAVLHHQGSEGAGNLFVFLVWLLASCTLLAGGSDITVQRLRVQGRSSPAWLSHAVNTIATLYCAWQGWWFTAAVSFLAAVVETAIFDGGSSDESAP